MAAATPHATLAATPPNPSISTEINIATRTLHTELNRLITTRLPLALPPHAPNPATYASGLAAFSAIYFAFEEKWRQLPRTHPLALQYHADAKILAFLHTLRPTGLERTARLARDLAALHAPFAQPVYLSDGAIVAPQAHNAVVKHWLEHISHRTAASPHILLAYAWTLYMAIFSGGRWIRSELARGGADFWLNAPGTPLIDEKIDPKQPPSFSFLSFDGVDDGEGLKAEFKNRLAGAESLLSERQRLEVVHEAKEIFKRCIDLVHELDREEVREGMLGRGRGVGKRWRQGRKLFDVLLGVLIFALVWTTVVAVVL